MSTRLVLRIGTFGPRGVGKTVSLSVASLCRGGAGLELAMHDKATIAYFRPLVEGLQRGDFPPATVPEMPRQVCWHADLDGREFDLRAADFAGELTDPIWSNGPDDFARAVSSWFGECDGILLFVDATAHDSAYHDALDKLFDELERQTTRHGSRRRAVGVLVTKADELPGATPDNITDPHQADQFLAHHPIYQRVKRHLERKSQALVCRVFLSSAVGWNFARVNDRSRRKVEPCNLFEALRWVVEQAGQIVAETHEQVLDEAEAELAALEQQADRSFDWLTYNRLPAAVDQLITENNLLEGPLAERALALRQRAERKRRQQRVSLAVTAAALAATLLAGLWATVRGWQEQDYDHYAQLVRPTEDDNEVRDRLSFYESQLQTRKWDWFWGLKERRQEADAQAAADRRLLARLEAEATFAGLSNEDRVLEKNRQQPRRHQAVLAYLERHGEATPEERKVWLQNVLQTTRPAWEEDRQAWEEAHGPRIRSAADYDSKIDRLRGYAQRHDALNRSEAERQAALLAEQKERDRMMYDELRRAVEVARSSASIKHTEQLAQAYLALGEEGQAMSAAVLAHLAALEEFKKPRDVSITVKAVRIPEAVLHRTWTGNPIVTVALTVGNQTRSTSRVTTRQSGGMFVATLEQRLGPFRAAWGEKQTLTCRLEVHRTVFANETAAVSLADDTFVLGQANGTVRMASNPSHPMKVEADLECEARLPSLPGFGEK